MSLGVHELDHDILLIHNTLKVGGGQSPTIFVEKRATNTNTNQFLTHITVIAPGSEDHDFSM
jgi:hypothetical protein